MARVWVWSQTVALFPGRSHIQFLIACSMQKWRGKRVACMMSVDMRVDVRGAVPDRCTQCNSHKPCIDQPWIYKITSCIDTVFRTLQSQVLWQGITRRASKIVRRASPPHVYPHVFLTTLSPSPFSSVFVYCKWSKTGGKNGLGTRLHK